MDNINTTDTKEIMAKIAELNKGINNIIEAQRIEVHAVFEVKQAQQADDKRIETLKKLGITLVNEIKSLKEKVQELENKTSLLN